MNIGILTLHLHRNYGGILQNYALQQVLLRLGHNPITIDKRPERSNIKFVISFLKHKINTLFGRQTSGIYYYEHTYRGGGFSKFVNKHINKTRSTPVYSLNLIDDYKLDALIFGSDQVWRKAFFTDEQIRNYYGDFLEENTIPRTAYAASFGVDQWEYSSYLTQECGVLAKKFTAISTREDSGVDLCKNLGVNDAVGVLDPTLLLSAQDYYKLCENVPPGRRRMLFAYILSNEAKDIALVKKIAQERGLTPVIVSAEFQATLSIEQWIAYFRDAEYVVTDSFHGTVFAILFHKEFNTIINKIRGGDRFYSLLNRLKLSNRIISCGEPPKNSDLNWVMTDHLIKVWQEKSLDFLNRALDTSLIGNRRG